MISNTVYKLKGFVRNLLPDFILTPIFRLFRSRSVLTTYKNLLPIGNQKKTLRNKEYKVYSQNGEDGLILYIFSRIGTHSNTFIEFGAGGISSNTENLIVNFGWSGLLIDGDDDQLNCLKNRLLKNNIGDDKVQLLKAWITKDNINDLFENNGMSGEVDLLSIDIDGNDYWIWDSIDVVQPRVVIVEYNASFGIEDSISIKYNDSHDRYEYDSKGWLHGASLKALEKLAEKKNYSLICCDSMGVNAFFVRNDLMKSNFLKSTSKNAFYGHKRRDIVMSNKKQYDEVAKSGDVVKV
jgi:hypothetical protein